jgi:periplasmic divalent cation tolerance protein
MKLRNDDRLMVFMTCDKKREAQKIATVLVRKKMAACVSIFPRGESRYWWKGKIESAREFLLVSKTKRSLLSRLIREVKRLHSYEVPEIAAVPIFGGGDGFLKWLDETLTMGGDNA